MTDRRPFFARADLVVFALAIALRLLHVRSVETLDPWADAPVIDEASYDAQAQRIAAGEWIGDEVFFQDPLYPYALGALYASVGRSFLAVRVLHALLDALAAATISALARRLGGRSAGWVGGVLAAVYAPFLHFVGQLDKATFVVAATTAFLAAWTLARERGGFARWLGVGASLGAACLLRGNFLAFLPVVPLVLLIDERRRALRPLLGYATGVVALLAPVAARNAAVGGSFVLTTAQAGTNFFVGNSPHNPYGVSISLPFVRTIPEHEADDWKREAERRSGATLARDEVSRFWAREAFAGIRRDPGAAAARFARKAAVALNDYEVPDNHSFEYARGLHPTLRIPIGFAVALALGGMGLLVHFRARPFLPLLAFFGIYVATLVATVTADRIRLPLAVPLLVAAGTVVPWSRACSGRQRALALLGAGALFGVAHLPVLPDGFLERKRFHARYEHALLLARKGDLDQAESVARSILDRYRGDPTTSLLLAELERHRGMSFRDPAAVKARFENAERLVREKVLPGAERLGDRTLKHKGDLALGWLSLLQGRDAEAVGHLESALAFDPDDADAVSLLANALGNLGRWEDAERRLEEAVRRNPGRWLIWDTLGLVRLQRGNRAGAAEAARRVAELGGTPSAALSRIPR